ncbi:MAG: putative NiFe hydrogenase alpha subunit [Bacteroidetes bacterium]|nr:putative NiFe hydrogenase alpha subunit [Bacteroidota bacterium]
MKNRVIKVDTLARVEGEGGIFIKIADGKITDTKLRIYEPPRFFEAFMRGRSYAEAPDITARICGICPIAYQMSSVHAMEDAFGMTVDGQLRELRRLIYCGEWIESHVLHVYMLHAPDFLGYEDALLLAKDKPDLVKDALRMKKIGNEIVTLLGGREIHPINVKVGGFYKVPGKTDLQAMVENLKWGRDKAIETVKLTSTFEFPDLEVPYEYVSLNHPSEYPMLGDRFITSHGLDIAVREYEFHFEERHIGHSNALHSVLKGLGAYHVGPLARYNLNFDKLTPLAKEVAQDVKMLPVVNNPFKSIVVRSIETVYAFDLALQIIAEYEEPPEPSIPVTPVPGIGFGASEAPRGTLYHRYRLDDEGLITDAKIVPPTAQNLPTIEADLRKFVTANIDMEREQLTWKVEQVVRNYDPCISCATHFVRIEWE